MAKLTSNIIGGRGRTAIHFADAHITSVRPVYENCVWSYEISISEGHNVPRRRGYDLVIGADEAMTILSAVIGIDRRKLKDLVKALPQKQHG